jgi:hypothetical protein
MFRNIQIASGSVFLMSGVSLMTYTIFDTFIYPMLEYKNLQQIPDFDMDCLLEKENGYIQVREYFKRNIMTNTYLFLISAGFMYVGSWNLHNYI